MINSRLDSTTKSMLGTADLSEIDTSYSYFALKWNFQMSLTSKITDQKTAKHPHFLVYYSFGLDESNSKIMKLHPFGLICSSYPGLQRWINNQIDDQFIHTRFFEDLTKFTDMERENRTQKVLRRHIHIGRDES